MNRIIPTFILIVFVFTNCQQGEQKTSLVREKIKIDNGWRFHLGDLENAHDVGLNVSSWETLDLPHDWTVQMPLKKDSPSGTAGGFVQGGIGWYRKALDIPDHYAGKKVFLQFDGIYENSTIWLNGKELGRRAYGYVTHYYDATDLIEPGKRNVLAVKVDASRQPADRWFSGAGIYRHVWMHVTDKLHIPVWGTYVSTPEVAKERAGVSLQTEIENDYSTPKTIELTSRVLDKEGNVVSENVIEETIEPDNGTIITQQFEVEKPELWSLAAPNLYKIESEVRSNGAKLDQYTTPFGIRKIEFSTDSGFMLNNKQVKLKGVNLHHDGGSLGAAVPLKVWERRFRKLKEIGVNSIRFSHNPHAPQVLDLCDQMGILVFDEMYDKWAIPWHKWINPEDTAYINAHQQLFRETWERDLSDFIDRDKNHPSVIIWSVGNETLEQLMDVASGEKIADDMIQLVKEMDPTRPVTAAMHPGSKEEGQEVPSSLMYQFDLASYNYRTHQFDDWKKEDPGLIFIATETKQYNNTLEDLSFDTVDYSNNSWWHMEDYIAGQYIWAGIDYLGESAGWPDKGFRGGIFYTNGFAKPNIGFTQSIYSDKPMVKLAIHSDSLAEAYNAAETWQISWWPPAIVDHWNFSEKENQLRDVYAFTNAESVELLLNGASFGVKNKEAFKDGVLRWQIPYKPGTLEAVAKNGDKIVSKDQLKTAEAPEKLVLYSDKTSLTTDNDDVAHIKVQAEDQSGIHNPLASNLVQFEIEGSGQIIGVDNGDVSDHYDWEGDQVHLMNGRCLVTIQSNGESGRIRFSVKSEGLEGNNVEIEVMAK